MSDRSASGGHLPARGSPTAEGSQARPKPGKRADGTTTTGGGQRRGFLDLGPEPLKSDRGISAAGDGQRRGLSIFSTLSVVQLLVGAGLAVFGLLTVLDYLSLRELLAEAGPRRLSKVVVDLHAVLAHPGAQVVELVLALLGLTIVVRSLRRLRPARSYD